MNKFSIIGIFCLATTLASCMLNKSPYADQTPIDNELVDSVVISKGTNDSAHDLVTKKLSSEISKDLIDRWNEASTIGPCKYISNYKMNVYLKNGEIRVFRINGGTMKESNDWGFDIKDKSYFDHIWRDGKF